jgi:hypothetical protein
MAETQRKGEKTMSAFIVGNKHISAMLQASQRIRYAGDGASYRWNGQSYYFNGNRQEIGQKLVDENYRSVNHRYGENERPHEFKMEYLPRFSAVQIIKACDCYNYQTCETPDWKETEAYAISQALRERAIDLLPGYDEAEWAIE